MKKSIVWIFAGIILFSGCNITSVGKTTPTISAQQIQQWAKQTIEAMGQTNATSSSVVSILPQASPTTRPILIQPTLAPTAIPTIRSVVIPTISYVQPVQKACDRMRFIADVTIEDNTVLSPNQAFRKTWRIQNSGSCTWSPGYRLIFDSGDPMSGPASVNIPQYVSPDQTIDISVDLRAPAANGIYQGNWMMQNASGMKFGTSDTVNQGIWVKIIVGSGNPATPVYPGLPSGGNCSIISVFPPAETRFTPGQELDFAWTVRNDSGVTWTAADFDIAFVGGTNMLKRQEETRRDLPYDVLPGNPLSVMIDAVVPSYPGRFTMTFGVVQNFEIACSVDVTLNVAY